MRKTAGGLLKKLCVLAFVAVSALLAARWYLVPRVDGSGSARENLELAIAKLVADRKVVTSRTTAIAESAHKAGASTSEEVAELMGDADLNRLALSYMGADWSIPRGAFLGGVREIRNLQRMREDERRKHVAELKDRMAKLERRSRIIDMRIGSTSDREKDAREKYDLEVQLGELRGSQTYLELVASDASATKKNGDAKIAAEEAVARLAAEYRKASVSRLDAVLADRLAEQKKALRTQERLKAVSDKLDFWPLNVLVPQPTAK